MLKLSYIGKMEIPGYPKDTRMWNVVEPELPGYNYKYGYPTFTLAGLVEQGLLQ